MQGEQRNTCKLRLIDDKAERSTIEMLVVGGEELKKLRKRHATQASTTHARQAIGKCCRWRRRRRGRAARTKNGKGRRIQDRPLHLHSSRERK
jgi:hypothetical protein